jgi:hypothetical protein
MPRRFAWPARLRSRRLWLVVLGAALVLRIALPYALRPIIASQASKAINARVDIGDVDLALYRAGIALNDVTIRPAGWSPEHDNGDPPLIAWKRFETAVRWLPLLRKTIRLREVVLESPRVAVDRLQDGDINLMGLVPASSAAPAAPPAAGQKDQTTQAPAKPGWGLGVDRIVLSDGGVRFRDLTMASVEPVELSLGSFEVKDIALRPDVYGGPAHVYLRAGVDEGRFVLDARLLPRNDGGFALTSHLKARRLPLRRTRVYVPNVGWSELKGEFGGALDYTLETGGRNEVRGRVTIDDLIVDVPALNGRGLAWKRLAVWLDPIDLAGHRAVVPAVELEGSYLVARARGGVVFPFIEKVVTGKSPDPQSGQQAPDATTPPAPAAPPATSPTQAAAAETTPWQWLVARIRVWDSLLHVISPDATFDAGCTLKAANVRSEGEDPATLSLVLTVGDGGTIWLDGKAHIQPLGFDGSVRADHVSLPDIVATAGVFPPGVVQSALLTTDLGIAAGVLAPTKGDVVVKGTIAFDDAQLAGAGGPTTEFGAKRLEFGIGELMLPGALPASGPPATADARLTGGTVTLRDMRVARTDPTKIDLHAGSIDAGIDEMTAPGIGPPPPDGGSLRLHGKLSVGDLLVGDAGGSALDVGAHTIEFAAGEFELPGLLAIDHSKVTAPMRLGGGKLSVDEPRVTGIQPNTLDGGARGFDLSIGELLVPGAMGGVPGDVHLRDGRLTVADPRLDDQRSGKLDASAHGVDVGIADLLVPGAMGGAPGDVRLRDGRLTVTDPRIDDERSSKLDVRARGVNVTLADVVAPGPGAPGFGGGALQLKGKLALTELAIAAPDPKEFGVGARTISVGIDELAAPGPGGAPTRLSLGEVALVSPRVQVTRIAEGLLLPPFGSASAAPPAATGAKSSPPPAAATKSPPPSPAPAQPAAVPPVPPVTSAAAVGGAPPPGLELDVDRFRLTDGKIGVTDRTVKPFYSGGLAPLDIDITKLRWPALTANHLRVAATSAQKGKIVITGALTATGGTVQIDGREIPLQQFNPYATTFSSYSIRRGRLDLATKASFGKGKYDTESTVTLHDFDLGSHAGDSLFKEQFGIPITMALALLRDLQGDIKLDIPVEGDQQGMHVGYLTIIGGALRHALVNALTSPLKLVGAIFSGDKVPSAPAPITFRLGRDELTEDGSKQINQLAKFLADRPGLGVALETTPTAADVRWMREHDLLQELGAPQGVVGFMKNLPKRGVRDRIRDALAAHEDSKKDELDADDSKTLEEWLGQRPAPTPQRIQELAAARLTQVERLLHEQHGIDAQRIVRRKAAPSAAPTDSQADSPPSVDIELGSVADLAHPEPAS